MHSYLKLFGYTQVWAGMIGLEPTKSLDQNQLPLPFRPHPKAIVDTEGVEPSWLIRSYLQSCLQPSYAFGCTLNRTSPPAHHAGEGATSFCRIEKMKRKPQNLFWALHFPTGLALSGSFCSLVTPVLPTRFFIEHPIARLQIQLGTCSSSYRLRLIEPLSSDRMSHFKSVSFCVTEVTATGLAYQ